MSGPSGDPDTLADPTPDAPDLTGRERIVRNVLASWGGYVVFIVGGFLVPPVIDHKVGQTGLGIWDFAWTLVSYFGLAQIGLGSSINRYVAKHRAQHDVDGLRRVTSSTMALQLIIATVVVLVTVVVTHYLPSWFGARLGADVGLARTLVAFLGASLAVQMVFDVFRGVITGCHRWDLHNAIASISYGAQVLANIAVLLAGYGLVGLGVSTLAVTIVTELVRRRLAYRICPEMRVSLAYLDAGQAKRSLAYGAKTTAGHLAGLVLVQGNSLMIAGHAGVAALALYARPMALLRHAETLADKFSFVLSPTASSLQGRGDLAAIRSLLIESSRAAAYFTFPLMVSFGFLGEAMLTVWMGPDYAHGHLVAILAGGYALSLAQKPVGSILAGMNLHGRLAHLGLIAAICGLGLSALLVGHYGLIGAAIALSVTRAVFNGFVAPLHVCRRLNVAPSMYYRETFKGPLLAVAPFAVALAILQQTWTGGPWGMLAVGAVLGIAILVPLYWRFVLTDSLRSKVLSRFRR